MDECERPNCHNPRQDPPPYGMPAMQLCESCDRVISDAVTAGDVGTLVRVAAEVSRSRMRAAPTPEDTDG